MLMLNPLGLMLWLLGLLVNRATRQRLVHLEGTQGYQSAVPAAVSSAPREGRVIERSSLAVRLQRQPSAPGVARDALATLALPEKHDEVAQLIVSELVTNALNHGAGRPSLQVDTDETGLRIAVGDEGPGFSQPNDRAETRGLDGGSGLRVVSELAESWGVEHNPTCVWVRLRSVPGPSSTERGSTNGNAGLRWEPGRRLHEAESPA